MTPTNVLLEAFTRALAEAAAPPEPGPPTHWLIVPNDFTFDHLLEAIVTVTALDADDNIVTTYAGPVDLFPTGQMGTPNDYGWLDGVLTLGCTAVDIGGGGLLVVDQATGVPSDFILIDWF